MSPVPTVTREQSDVRKAPVLSLAALQALLGPAKEMVVDWQMPSEGERKR